jgi:alpha-glucosidase
MHLFPPLTRRIALATIVAFQAALLAAPTLSGAEVVRSPDGAVEVELKLVDGEPVYLVRRFGQEVIRPSRLGFLLSDAAPLTQNFEIVSETRDSVDGTWTQPWGEKKETRCAYNELRVLLRQRDEQARSLAVVFRVFDDGVGFRYEIPEQANLQQVLIADELTEFAFADDASAWWIPAFEENRDEYIYKNSPVSSLRKVHTPVTFQTRDDVYLSIHEAALVDYSCMALANVGDRTLKAELYPWSDGVKVRGKTPLVTPWRTIQIVDTPGELITSSLNLNLNEPCKLDDVSWIRPGKYVGVWWEMHIGRSTWGSGEKHGANTANVKRYIDFAEKYGFDGVLVEGWNEGWDGDWQANGKQFNFTRPYPDFDIDELCRYAKTKDVHLIGHHETACGIGNYESQLDDAMAFYERLGVPLVKSGYVGYGRGIERLDAKGQKQYEWHFGQFMVRHHQHVIESAARHHIMMDVHEPVKPTGLRRTYPNMLSCEAARGQEYNAWAADGGNPPEHTAVLTFTRLLAGPMDFTPGVFDINLKLGHNSKNRINTTLAHQLALYVVIYSPIQMAADLPESYEAHLDAFQFIRDVPTDWNDTRVLNAEIGDYLTVVRQKRDSDEWFLGAVTDEVGRTLRVHLAFLDRDREYVAEVYRDADEANWRDNPSAYAVEKRDVDANTVLALRLAPGGGQAIRFYPKDL